MINKSVITDIFILAHETSSSTHPPERHSIPWPISSNQWTPRIFSFIRSRDNSTISFPRSTLKAHWVLPLHLLRILIYVCVCVCVLFLLLIWICVFFAYLMYPKSFFFYIYSSFSLTLVCFPMFIIHMFCHFYDKK